MQDLKKKKKNKRALFLIWMTSFLALACSAVYMLYPFTINLVFNVFPFFSSTTNNRLIFYGENIDMSQILPASQRYIVNKKGQDLIDIAADLGINLIRITNAQQSFQNNSDSVYTKSQWNQVLNKMHSKRIKALILIETASNNADYYTPDIRPVYLDLVQKYIESGVFSHPAVYAVDIKNEPLLTDANVKMLQVARTLIKEKYPHLKQTIGGWATLKPSQDPHNPANYNWSDFAAGQKIAVDFYSIHMYKLATEHWGIGVNPNLATKVFLSQVEHGLQTTKPILIGEFGEANGDAVSDQDSIGNPQLQANVYQGVYQALQEMHNGQIIGAVAFDFYSRDQYPDAWAIVKDHGDYLFPAASILQAYASGKNDASLLAMTVVHSHSYLLKNADDYGTENLQVSDRIGLKLLLDSNLNYSLSLSTNGLLQPVELFHYNPVKAAYYAVYQATRKGNIQLTITLDIHDKPTFIDVTHIYTVTIHVQ